ncbi:methylmalonyl-CoA mutase [Spirosoma pollinicola]|uniref:Methylmalonyl-CoA mutase n=2 Tax=Spirosoma pollinicola TaxID=2057025 RepID=A0A2K8Z4D7_9BACT|nr:methylmalonyl-CoA mutase [Spirosoma pollinicola]
MASFFLPLFPETDKSAWLMQVQKEYKPAQAGEDEYESLRWHTEEGFTLEPYYTANDLTEGPVTTRSLETIQAVQKHSPGWLNAPEWIVSDEKSDNSSLRDVLTRGADALVLSLSTQTGRHGEKLSRLLNNIKLSENPVFFRLSDDTATDFIQTLKTIAPYKLKGGLLMVAGKSTAEATRLTVDSPQFRTICVSSHVFHNAGATATQELAFTLASLADTYDQLTDSGLTIEQLVPKTILSVSVGTSYFMEIAKLRALRVLLSRLVAAYQSSSLAFFIHCQTSTFYDAKATPNTNLLRATTEAMAAVIGGCDALTVHPYDSVLGTPATGDNDMSDKGFSARIARNVSVLLKEESYLDKVADPSAGSYYIENLTYSLVEAAWTLFLTVENQGGFAKAVASRFVQTEIERAYQAKVDAVRNGKVLVGVTKFRFDEPSTQTYNPLTDQTGLLPDRRLAAVFE